MGPFMLFKSFLAVVKLFTIFKCALEKHGVYLFVRVLLIRDYICLF